MATRDKRKKDKAADDLKPPQGFWGHIQRNADLLSNHIMENPFLYIGALAFVIVVSLAAALFEASDRASAKVDASAFVRALEEEDPAARVDALDAVVKEGSAFLAEALYLQGEEAIKARNFDRARTAFERLRAEKPDFAFTPDAVEGLGYMEEEEKRYEAALNFYQEVMDAWVNSFAARRQPFNVGRCQEKLERYEDAIASYQTQVQTFPGSSVYVRAQQALARLRKSHGDLFSVIVEVSPFEFESTAIEGAADTTDGEPDVDESQDDTAPEETPDIVPPS